MRGKITYYGSGQPVAGATVNLTGPVSASTVTDESGQYAFDHISAGTWQVAPHKLEDINNAVTALDAVYALQSAVGSRTLTPEQQLACSVTGSGTVTSVDAAMILRFDVGLITQLPAAQACGSDWAFAPIPTQAPNQEQFQPSVSANGCQSGSITFAPLSSGENDQDFSAVLFGDCTGDWQPQNSGSLTGLAGSGRVHLGRMRVTGHGHRLRVPLYVDTAGSFRALDVELDYDPARLSVQAVHRVGAARTALMAANARVPGVVRIALATLEPLRGGTALMLEVDGHGSRLDAAVRVARARLE